MKTPFLKGVGVIIIAILSIGICVVGFQRSRQNQQEQQTITSTEKISVQDARLRLDELKDALEEFYTDGNEQFIVEGTTYEEVHQIATEIDEMNVGAELEEEQTILSESFNNLATKITIQEEANALYEQPKNDWQDVEERQPIRTGVEESDFTDIENRLESLPDGDWKDSVLEFVGHGREQILLIEILRETIEKYASGSSEVSYEDYLSTVSDISYVRNEEMRAELLELANQVSN